MDSLIMVLASMALLAMLGYAGWTRWFGPKPVKPDYSSVVVAGSEHWPHDVPRLGAYLTEAPKMLEHGGFLVPESLHHSLREFRQLVEAKANVSTGLAGRVLDKEVSAVENRLLSTLCHLPAEVEVIQYDEYW